MRTTLAELARLLGSAVRGNPAIPIHGVNSLDRAGSGEIAFYSGSRYRAQLSATRAGAVILRSSDAGHYTGNILISENPALAFAHTCEHLCPVPVPASGVHPASCIDAAAVVAPTVSIAPGAIVGAAARIGEGARIGPGCVIDDGAEIGPRTELRARSVVERNCVIGADCLIHSGAVIGADGFGFVRDGERWVKQPQLGRVVIGDRVEIGANSTIDRGTLGDTVIGDGVKIDNLVHVAHNVRIGADSAIAACVGIAGSTVIGRRCTIAGQAGIIDHLEIADDVHITAGSLVTSSIGRAGVYSASLKAEPVATWRRNAARLHTLDDMARRLKRLEERLDDTPKE